LAWLRPTTGRPSPRGLACSTCHDAIDFVTGINHGTTANGGPQLDDKLCGSCHTAASIPINHYTNNLTPNNPVTPTGLANLTYEISTATATATTVSGGTGSDVAIKFRIMKNGTAAVLATPAATITQTLAGFSGSPGFLLAYALPQEGITALRLQQPGTAAARTSSRSPSPSQRCSAPPAAPRVPSPALTPAATTPPPS
jgi:hypothetical protein